MAIDDLWAAADKLRGNTDAAEYKHVVSGLIFLKYVSDAFLEKHDWLMEESSNPKSEYFVKEEQARYGVAEDRDEYLADNIFWVPAEARWGYLQKNAKRPEIGKLVDDAMTAIERDNKTLKGVLPKDYARSALNKVRLGEIIDLIAAIGLGDKESRQKDIFGGVHEYFLAHSRDTLFPGLLSGELEAPEICGPVEQPRVEVQTETVIYTIGHSNHPIDKFVSLLKQHGISAVADVRSVPYSRFNPQFNREAFAALLEEAGIAYVFLGKELGARPDDRSCYENGQADFERMAERAEFKRGLDRVIKGSDEYRIALMCAEKEPLDCHRTILVCRNLKTLGVNIKHILPDGSLEDHRETESRLLKITRCERGIFDQGVSDSEMIERAYKRRARDIAYEQDRSEAHHE